MDLIATQPGRDHEAHRARERLRNALGSEKGRDIGEIPPVLHPRRKKAAARNFLKFCDSYCPQVFDIAWCDDHKKVIGQIEESVLKGGLFATAMPRGSGKTSLCETAAVWAILYGHRSFVVLIGQTEDKATEMMDSLKTDFECNDLLLEDFPEATYPVRKLEGIGHRCKGQLYRGERTHIGWTSDELIMPTIPGSKASGAIVRVCGITGDVRGMKYKRRDGRSVRPDLVIVDDPQTHESAYSPSQCATRERILAADILGLAGPRKKISGVMPCTVIRQGDMADRMLDRKKHPEWKGTRTKMVYSFPSNEKLWEEYKQRRHGELEAGGDGSAATAFYAANREAMDAGAVVAWPGRHDPDEVSAIQHAMNLLFRDRGAFFSEYQNEPLPDLEPQNDDLTHALVSEKLNRLERGAVPTACSRLTAFIDVQQTLLWYVVSAWEDDFTGYVIDYGTFPEQKVPYFTLKDATHTLAREVQAAGLEGQLYGGLERLTARILGREWRRDDGASLKVERCLIDANWAESTGVVFQFCRQSAFSPVLTPSRGKYVGAAGSPMSEWAARPGERKGLNWKLGMAPEAKSVRRVIYDTNFWKTFTAARLLTAMGDRGCLSLFGADPKQHRMFADQVCSEYKVRTQGRGRECDEWKLRPERPDNHLWDCLVGSVVAASMQGVSVPNSQPTAKPKTARVSFADLQRKKRA